MDQTVTNEMLQKGVAIITPPTGLKEKLEDAQKNQRQLIVKLGFDPTAPDLHLGHAVVLRKIRQFQDAGHKSVIIVGDFTARIGDPTGRNKARPPLSENIIQENAKTYVNQLSKVVDIEKVEIRFNSEWLSKMTCDDVVTLMSNMTAAQILQREDFSNRYNNNIPISLHELFYPIMQGYDSVEINADIEIGGTEQLFNCLVGRSLQESNGKPGQIVISMPLLIGLDGKEKMSKSQNNYIALTEELSQICGKIMAMTDHLLENYLDLVTDFPPDKIAGMKMSLLEGTLHSMDAKQIIAENIVMQYNGAGAISDLLNQYSSVKYPSKKV